ncbi:cytoplasmic protein [Coprinopsis cinerea okayama7|uniref:Cytoplasmic protein n=1 Tax=Coprinopsis cinerea (strain Okayama-7 / 130 / ATCC MYA-4618 / FGSC 9003) TaxID=240176 RepID=A8P7X7_COPC7|nr:cytoplasmic protein [Coprinopsis cinerea okayama7\|eukprot:XP_001839450.2 cytoplasmic protein [Coprinopsis cinerea okayama7\
MSRRLNKRQQRELEELQALGGSPGLDQDAAESEEEPVARPQKAAAGFAALMGTEDDNENESEDDEPKAKAKKSKKKKKKAGTPVVESPKPASTPPPKSTPTPTAKSEKKALKRAKQKEKKAADDELEQALKELAIKYPPSQKISQKTAGGQGFSDLISVSPQHLDPDAEMRKFFGSKVVQANRAGSSSGASAQARRKAATVRSVLTRPQPTWWAAKAREGLSIRPLTDEEVQAKLKGQEWEPVHDDKWWTVEYSKRYKALTKVFMRTVASGEHAQAVDFVDRALFTYERAFVGAFNFTVGANRLDFDRVENRPFFLAIHRQVADLNRRGCVRTALEFGKLLYSLDPWGDPHGSLLHLDYLAIKAGMHQWVIDLCDIFTARREETSKSKADARIDPSLLPGFSYARALALRIAEESGQKGRTSSTEALKSAMQDFPSVLPLLVDKLDATLPVAIRSHPDFKIETNADPLSTPVAALHLLSHLYVQRSNTLWKEHTDWLTTTATETFEKLPSRLPVTPTRQAFLDLYEHPGPRFAAYRHLIVLESDHRSLFPFIPRTVQQNSRSLSCDPLPPTTAVSSYDEAFFDGVDDLLSFRTRTRRERAMDERRLAQMIPDAAFRQQLEAFFNGNRGLQERFQGGILQFAQAVAQLPPEVLEDMMLAEAMGGGPGLMAGGLGDGGGMPGGFDELEAAGLEIADLNADGAQPLAVHLQQVERAGQEEEQEEEDFEDDEEDEEDDEEDYSPMPRAIRNLLGRLWGRTATAEDDSSDDEETELLDNNGVD